MNRFIWMLLGVLLSFGVVAAGVFVFVFFNGMPSNVEEGKILLPAAAPANNPTTFEMTLSVPSALKNVNLGTGKVHVVTYIFSHGIKEPGVTVAKDYDTPPAFPLKLEIPVTTTDLTRRLQENPARNLMFKIFVCNGPGMEAKGTKAHVCNPNAEGFSARTLYHFAGNPGPGQTIVLGEQFLSRHYKQMDGTSKPCGPGPEIKGKIIPTHEFLAKVGKGKRIAVAFRPETRTLPGKTEAEFVSGLTHYQFIDLSPEGAPYSIPVSKFSAPDNFLGYVSICGPKEDLKTCVFRTFPPALTDGHGTGFLLAPENMEVPHCSDTRPVNFHAHWIHPFDPASPSKGMEAHNRDAQLSPDILEGQFF